MKLRILGNTIRLRLSQSEVRTLVASGRVEETTRFGPDRALVYALVAEDGAPAIDAELEGTKITIRLPAAVASTWATTEAVSLRGEHAIDDGSTLLLLIEKDFKCAVPRPGEESYDGFPNPVTSC